MHDILSTNLKEALNEYEPILNQLEQHDALTYEHSLRVGRLMERIVPHFSIENPLDVLVGSVLHDIGKASIPLSVLGKPTSLTEEEFAIMKSHTKVGHTTLSLMKSSVQIRDLALLHHEREDGSGYFRQTRLPLEVQLLSLCDTFDALTEDRVYRKGKTKEEAWTIILGSKGQFDLGLAKQVQSILH